MRFNTAGSIIGIGSSLFLIITGVSEWSLCPNNAITERASSTNRVIPEEEITFNKKVENWKNEKDIRVLAIRSDGKFKIGLGLAWLSVIASAGRFYTQTSDEWITQEDLKKREDIRL